jgi:hypothetical protein
VGGCLGGEIGCGGEVLVEVRKSVKPVRGGLGGGDFIWVLGYGLNIPVHCSY